MLNLVPNKWYFPDKQKIRTQIKELLEATQLGLTFLRNGKEEGRWTRYCIDFRRMNKLIIPECYPFPTINDVIDSLFQL